MGHYHPALLPLLPLFFLSFTQKHAHSHKDKETKPSTKDESTLTHFTNPPKNQQAAKQHQPHPYHPHQSLIAISQQEMQSPASSIQSPRPQGWQAQQNQQPGAFEKELMASLHVLLNQLGEVERQGLVMFHKIEESFKHPYTQQEAIADTANLLIQLETLTTQSKTTGFGALTHLPTSQTVASTPTPSASAIPTTTTTTPGPSGPGAGGTPKPMFLSPRMQNHIHNNQHNNTPNNAVGNNNAGGTGVGAGNADTQMMSPTPVSVVGTPTGTGAGANAQGGVVVVGSPSPFPTSDILMSATTPIADPNHPPPPPTTGTGTAGATPATPSAWSSNPSAALAQMLDSRQKDVQALSTEKRKLKTNFKVAAQMIKI